MSDSEDTALIELKNPKKLESAKVKDEVEETPLALLEGNPKKRKSKGDKESKHKSKHKHKKVKKESTSVVDTTESLPKASSQTANGASAKAKKQKNPATNGKKKTIKLENKEDTPDMSMVVDPTPEPSESKSPKAESNDNDKDNDNEDEEEYKWWEDEKFGQGPERWQTLEHNGVLFPPPYEPLPSYVKMYYAGQPVNLPAAAEEVAGFFAAMLDTDHAKNPVFQKNFFNDFCEVLNQNGGCGVPILDFDKCDFSKMHAHFESLRQEKKNMSRAEKKALKDERDALEEPFRTCLLNGRRENVGNFRVEPPGLFRGRGAHPKTGKLKRRVYPEDITINISDECPIPPAPPGHTWGAVKCDKSVVWLAMWRENISDAFKYVKLAANSSIKGMSDMKKFETARELKNHITAIRADYNKMLKDQFMQNRQIATATYLIDIFALRAGGEKAEDEADTVGCCSLRYEHVTLKPPNTVVFDFLGKDSIRFYQEVEVDRQVFKNLRIFKKSPKKPGDDLFDRINPTVLNKHLQGYMKGLTAKVFRTYNASKTMQDQMDLISNEGTVAERVMKYNAANRTVAILCNHQRTVSKQHLTSVGKIQDRIKEMEWQKLRLKQMIISLEPNLKKKDPKYFAEIEDMPKEEARMIVHAHIEKQKQSVQRKFDNENEKRRLDDKEALDEDEIKTRLAAVDELQKVYEAEITSGSVEPARGATVEKLKAQIEKIETRIATTSFQLKDKEDNSEVSLGTSKMNYIDPRLTVMFSKKFDVPIERLFTKTLRDKFTWAIESTDENWRF